MKIMKKFKLPVVMIIFFVLFVSTFFSVGVLASAFDFKKDTELSCSEVYVTNKTPVVLNATLTDESGEPISGENISFFIYTNENTSIFLSSDLTDYSGFAESMEFYLPLNSGIYVYEVIYEGNDEYHPNSTKSEIYLYNEDNPITGDTDVLGAGNIFVNEKGEWSFWFDFGNKWWYYDHIQWPDFLAVVWVRAWRSDRTSTSDFLVNEYWDLYEWWWPLHLKTNYFSYSASETAEGIQPGSSIWFEAYARDDDNEDLDFFDDPAEEKTIKKCATVTDDDNTPPELSVTYYGSNTDANPGYLEVVASDNVGLSVDPSGTYNVLNTLGTQPFSFTAIDNDADRPGDSLSTTKDYYVTIIDDDPTEPVVTYYGHDDAQGYDILLDYIIYDSESGIHTPTLTWTADVGGIPYSDTVSGIITAGIGASFYRFNIGMEYSPGLQFPKDQVINYEIKAVNTDNDRPGDSEVATILNSLTVIKYNVDPAISAWFVSNPSSVDSISTVFPDEYFTLKYILENNAPPSTPPATEVQIKIYCKIQSDNYYPTTPIYEITIGDQTQSPLNPQEPLLSRFSDPLSQHALVFYDYRAVYKITDDQYYSREIPMDISIQVSHVQVSLFIEKDGDRTIDCIFPNYQIELKTEFETKETALGGVFLELYKDSDPNRIFYQNIGSVTVNTIKTINLGFYTYPTTCIINYEIRVYYQGAGTPYGNDFFELTVSNPEISLLPINPTTKEYITPYEDTYFLANFYIDNTADIDITEISFKYDYTGSLFDDNTICVSDPLQSFGDIELVTITDLLLANDEYTHIFSDDEYSSYHNSGSAYLVYNYLTSYQHRVGYVDHIFEIDFEYKDDLGNLHVTTITKKINVQLVKNPEISITIKSNTKDYTLSRFYNQEIHKSKHIFDVLRLTFEITITNPNPFMITINDQQFDIIGKLDTYFGDKNEWGSLYKPSELQDTSHDINKDIVVGAEDSKTMTLTTSIDPETTKMFAERPDFLNSLDIIQNILSLIGEANWISQVLTYFLYNSLVDSVIPAKFEYIYVVISLLNMIFDIPYFTYDYFGRQYHFEYSFDKLTSNILPDFERHKNNPISGDLFSVDKLIYIQPSYGQVIGLISYYIIKGFALSLTVYAITLSSSPDPYTKVLALILSGTEIILHGVADLIYTYIVQDPLDENYLEDYYIEPPDLEFDIEPDQPFYADMEDSLSNFGETLSNILDSGNSRERYYSATQDNSIEGRQIQTYSLYKSSEDLSKNYLDLSNNLIITKKHFNDYENEYGEITDAQIENAIQSLSISLPLEELDLINQLDGYGNVVSSDETIQELQDIYSVMTIANYYDIKHLWDLGFSDDYSIFELISDVEASSSIRSQLEYISIITTEILEPVEIIVLDPTDPLIIKIEQKIIDAENQKLLGNWDNLIELGRIIDGLGENILKITNNNDYAEYRNIGRNYIFEGLLGKNTIISIIPADPQVTFGNSLIYKVYVKNLLDMGRTYRVNVENINPSWINIDLPIVADNYEFYLDSNDDLLFEIEILVTDGTLEDSTIEFDLKFEIIEDLFNIYKDLKFNLLDDDFTPPTIEKSTILDEPITDADEWIAIYIEVSDESGISDIYVLWGDFRIRDEDDGVTDGIFHILGPRTPEDMFPTLFAIDADNDRPEDSLETTQTISFSIIDDDTAPPDISIEPEYEIIIDEPTFDLVVSGVDYSGILFIEMIIEYENIYGTQTVFIEHREIEDSIDETPVLEAFTIASDIFDDVEDDADFPFNIIINTRDNDNDRIYTSEDDTEFGSNTFEMRTEDDNDPPELSNIVITDDIYEIQISLDATDQSGIGDIDIKVNNIIIEPITQSQIGDTFYFTLANQWILKNDVYNVEILVTDADNDRPNDALTSSISGTFEITLDEMYDYVDWELEELKNYVDDNLFFILSWSIRYKLWLAQECLEDAYDLIEEEYITCGLFHDAMAQVLVEITEFETGFWNMIWLISDDDAEYIVSSLHIIRNNIVILMGASVGTEQGYDIGLIEVDLIDLTDFIEEEISAGDRACLEGLIALAVAELEVAIFEISLDIDTECTLTATQYTLDLAKCEVNNLLNSGKISGDLANVLLVEIIQAQAGIELVKNSI